MKSNRQRRQEIKEKRRKRAVTLAEIDRFESSEFRPESAVSANHDALRHNSPCARLPLFYMDRPFLCADCGSRELWTAKRQKWWYEIAKGDIYSVAIRCLRCRKMNEAIKEDQKRQREAKLKVEPHPHEAFFRRC